MTATNTNDLNFNTPCQKGYYKASESFAINIIYFHEDEFISPAGLDLKLLWQYHCKEQRAVSNFCLCQKNRYYTLDLDFGLLLVSANSQKLQQFF